MSNEAVRNRLEVSPDENNGRHSVMVMCPSIQSQREVITAKVSIIHFAVML